MGSPETLSLEYLVQTSQSALIVPPINTIWPDIYTKCLASVYSEHVTYVTYVTYLRPR